MSSHYPGKPGGRGEERQDPGLGGHCSDPRVILQGPQLSMLSLYGSFHFLFRAQCSFHKDNIAPRQKILNLL